MDINGLYDSLLDCSFRGVIFTVPDSRHEVGRRTARFFFPGQDATSFQDLGEFAGPIRIKGVILGADYVRRGQALAEALRAPGPGTLVHPWLGDVQVVLLEPAAISYALAQQRMVTFEAVFARVDVETPAALDTLSGLMDAADALKAQARAFLRGLLKPLVMALAAVGYVGGFLSRLGTMWISLAGGALTGVVSQTLASLPALGALTAGTAYADSVSDQMAAPPEALAQAANPPIPAAVAAGGDIATPAATDPRATATLLLAGVSTIDAASADPAPGPVLAVAAQAQMVAALLPVASDIPFVSAQEARAWRDQVVAGIDLAASRAAALVSLDATSAGGLWRALLAARGAWMADMNQVIGRLPNVVTLNLPATVPVWLAAQYLVGDQPARVLETYHDLIARNDIRHPAMATGPLEVLEASL